MMRRVAALGAGMALTAGMLVGGALPASAAAPVDPAPVTAVVTANANFGAATTVTVSWTDVSASDPALSSLTITSTPAVPAGTTGTCTAALAAAATSCTYVGLTVGQPYVFTVTATNADGSTADNSAPVTPSTKPAAPTIVASTNGVTRAWVDWSVPNNGGATITRYDVYVDDVLSNVAGCFDTTNTECVLTGLTNATSYAITVTATNVQGASAKSAVRTVTPAAGGGVPSAPTGVSAVQIDDAGDKKIQVAFTPPAEVAGFDTTVFNATCTRTAGAASAALTVAGVQSPLVTGVGTDTTTYTCTVTATNANGASVASSASNAVTINTTAVPGAPTVTAATGGSLQAALTWSAPSPLPVSPITGYQVQYFATGAADWSSPIATGSTATSFTVTSLEAGTYRFRVRAVNAGGVGAWSGDSPLTTVISGTLNAPTGVTGTPGTAQVSLSWTAPTGGTLSPTSYQVRYSSNSGSTWTELSATGSTATTATVTGLTNGTAYVFGVRAINGSVTSTWSANSPAVNPGPPGAPTSVAGTAGNGQVALTWTAPTGTPAATGYQVQYSSNSGTTWLPATPLAATATSLTATGLTNGTAYVFRVRALNGTVTGNYSANSSAITPRAPAATMVIVGERGTGNNRNRVFVDGVTTSLVGQKVTPFYRFPGQRGFTAGTGIQTVDANGEFNWTRKTGKRIVVQFRFGDLRSNNAVIDAR